MPSGRALNLTTLVRAAASLCVLAAGASRASAALLNPGFEQGSTLISWSTFNNVSSNVAVATTTPHGGTRVCKVSGGYNGNPNWSGLYQNLPAFAGQIWEAGAWVRHNTGNALTGTGNSLRMKIEFYRVAGGQHGGAAFLDETELVSLDGSTVRDVWLQRTVQAVAPAETVEARIAFVFMQSGNAPGAALIDDVTFATVAGPQTDWTLIWQDEFDGSTVDTTKWRVENLHLNKNNELQYYAPDEVYIQSGELVLRSRQRYYCGYDDDGHWGCYNYTSGLVETRDRFATGYGRIEVRAKLPSTKGIWPAHWMMPDAGGWPPEIDIMELLGHEPTRVYMSHHWGTWPDVQTDTGSYVGPDFSQDYHVFAVEWFPDRLDWYVDDLLCYRSTIAVPQEPFYIILNTAVGGNWPGNPDGTTVFPQHHRIDYVRVYVPADPGQATVAVADGTSASATADGSVEPDEYVGAVNGINAGLGDRIGENSVFHIDSRADGRLNLAFEAANAWPTDGATGVVVYVDSRAGGWAATADLHDVGTLARRLVSGRGLNGARADLYFAPGFRPDYAICFEPNQVSIFELHATTHTLVNGALLGAEIDLLGGADVRYRIDDGGQGGRIREFEARLAHFAVPQGGSFRLIATLLNGDTAFRANEFVGVAPGNAWDGYYNPGQTPVLLKTGDFLEFESAARYGDADGDGDVDAADIAVFVECLGGPGAMPAPPAPLDADSCLNSFDVDSDGDSDLADYAALQPEAGSPPGD
ncbi:MAG: family 16 glycosylhydrolase [Phycisphaerae bacterium]|nr:family 16 glycosylhydrolase [Phycisphaerae bacterium]HQL54939.1 family 16 glycosylhydrolase [Phycisphaerae bacterium]